MAEKDDPGEGCDDEKVNCRIGQPQAVHVRDEPKANIGKRRLVSWRQVRRNVRGYMLPLVKLIMDTEKYPARRNARADFASRERSPRNRSLMAFLVRFTTIYHVEKRT